MTLFIMAALLKDSSSLSQRQDRSEVELGDPREFCTKTIATVYIVKSLIAHSYASKFPPDDAHSAVEQTAFCHNKALTAAMTVNVLSSTCRYLCDAKVVLINS